jgi:hypothetical protein
VQRATVESINADVWVASGHGHPPAQRDTHNGWALGRRLMHLRQRGSMTDAQRQQLDTMLGTVRPTGA